MTLDPKKVTLSGCSELHDAVTGPKLLQSLLKEREEIFSKVSSLTGMSHTFLVTLLC